MQTVTVGKRPQEEAVGGAESKRQKRVDAAGGGSQMQIMDMGGGREQYPPYLRNLVWGLVAQHLSYRWHRRLQTVCKLPYDMFGFNFYSGSRLIPDAHVEHTVDALRKLCKRPLRLVDFRTADGGWNLDHSYLKFTIHVFTDEMTLFGDFQYEGACVRLMLFPYNKCEHGEMGWVTVVHREAAIKSWWYCVPSLEALLTPFRQHVDPAEDAKKAEEETQEFEAKMAELQREAADGMQADGEPQGEAAAGDDDDDVIFVGEFRAEGGSLVEIIDLC